MVRAGRAPVLHVHASLNSLFGFLRIMLLLLRYLLITAFSLAFMSCSRDMTDLRSIPIPGVNPLPFQNESTLPLRLAVIDLADSFVAKGATRGVDGQRLAADASITNEEIALSVDKLLGPGWQRSTGFDSSRPHIHIMVWETTGRHKRFYAIAAWDEAYTNMEGCKYRPMQSVFSRH